MSTPRDTFLLHSCNNRTVDDTDKRLTGAARQSAAKRIGIGLTAAMRARGMKPTALHKRTGVSRQTIYRIRDGTTLPTTETLLLLAQELGVTPGDLIDGTVKAPKSSEKVVALRGTMDSLKQDQDLGALAQDIRQRFVYTTPELREFFELFAVALETLKSDGGSLSARLRSLEGQAIPRIEEESAKVSQIVAVAQERLQAVEQRLLDIRSPQASTRRKAGPR